MGRRKKTATLVEIHEDPTCGGKHYIYSVVPPHQENDHIIVVVVQDRISGKYQALGFHGDITGTVTDWKPLMSVMNVKCPWTILWRLGYRVLRENGEKV